MSVTTLVKREFTGYNMARRIALLTLALLLVFSNVPSALTNSEAVTHKYATYENVKAAFIYNFLLFVDWPDNHFKNNGSSIKIGILGNKETLDAMEAATKKRKAKGRNIIITKLSPEESLAGFDAVYISSRYKSILKKIISKTGRDSILLIGDFKGFAKSGGVINFFKENEKVRFEVNIDAAKERGLKISSRLLQLARVVRDGRVQ